MPLPHTNIIMFQKMMPKNYYLIWLEQNKFFVALSKEGVLYIWSKITGKLL